MKKHSFIAILAVCLLSLPVRSGGLNEATALSQLQGLIREFVSQYRLTVDMKHVYLDFNEKFYHKKKKKNAKALKTFKEQALKMKITFKHQGDRLVPLPVESIANRLDQEVIQKFCKAQNLKSKSVRIIVLDSEDAVRTPSEVLESADTLATVSLQDSPTQEDIGFKITAKCVARSKKVRR